VVTERNIGETRVGKLIQMRLVHVKWHVCNMRVGEPSWNCFSIFIVEAS
jgi:hypothetical protein